VRVFSGAGVSYLSELRGDADTGGVGEFSDSLKSGVHCLFCGVAAAGERRFAAVGWRGDSSSGFVLYRADRRCVVGKRDGNSVRHEIARFIHHFGSGHQLGGIFGFIEAVDSRAKSFGGFNLVHRIGVGDDCALGSGRFYKAVVRRAAGIVGRSVVFIVRLHGYWICGMAVGVVEVAGFAGGFVHLFGAVNGAVLWEGVFRRAIKRKYINWSSRCVRRCDNGGSVEVEDEWRAASGLRNGTKWTD